MNFDISQIKNAPENIASNCSEDRVSPDPRSEVAMSVDVAALAIDKARQLTNETSPLCTNLTDPPLSSAERLIETMPSVPLSSAGETKMESQDHGVLETMRQQQSDLMNKIGKVLERIEDARQSDPTTQRTILRKLYQELAELENSYTLLDTFHRANKYVLITMPIPEFELQRLDKADRVERLLKPILSESLLLSQVPYLNRKRNEIVRGFAEAIANAYEDIAEFVKVITNNPEQFKKALEEVASYAVTHMREISSGAYDSLVDATERTINEAVTTEGESLAEQVGYAIGSMITLFIPATGTAKIANVSFIALRNIARTRNFGGKTELLTDKKVYTPCITNFCKLYPEVSAITARALITKMITRYSQLPPHDKTEYAASFLGLLSTPSPMLLLTNKTLLKYIVDSAYDLPPSMLEDVIVNIVNNKIPITIDPSQESTTLTLSDYILKRSNPFSTTITTVNLPTKKDTYRFLDIS